MMKQIIGFWIDKPKSKPRLLCKFGLHKAAKYIMEKTDNGYYFVCEWCGRRYRI